VIKINPMKYIGWKMKTRSRLGVRIGVDGVKMTNCFSKNIKYSVSGKYGLQLELKNGKKVMIGTQKAKELEAIIYQIERKNKEY